ncbi:MAG: transporter [Sphingomonadales bacterium]|nr:transporter [Sphingomonadales bacterium]
MMATRTLDAGLQPEPATSGPTLLRSLVPLLILAFSMVIGFMVMGSFGTVQEGAKAELKLSDYSLGIIQGVGAAIPLVLFSVPIGILVDRTRRTRLLVGLALVWTAGTLLTAVAGSMATLFIARMLVGIGTTGALTAVLSIGSDLCAPTERGRAMLIISLGKALGVALALAAGGALYGMFAHGTGWFATIMPWRGVHFVLACVSAVMVLPLLALREPQRREVAEAIHSPFRVLAAELWTRRGFLIPLFIGQSSVVMADTAAAIWAPPVLSRSYGLSPDQFAGWMGLLLFSTGVLGTIVGGFVADVGHKSRLRGGILTGAVVAAIIGIPAALFAIGPSVTLFAIGLGTLALAGSVTGVTTSVTLTVLIPNELRGLCIGAFIAVAGLVGYGIAPVLVAAVSGLLGGEAHIAPALAVVGVTVSMISVAAFIVAMRFAPQSATAL